MVTNKSNGNQQNSPNENPKKNAEKNELLHTALKKDVKEESAKSSYGVAREAIDPSNKKAQEELRQKVDKFANEYDVAAMLPPLATLAIGTYLLAGIARPKKNNEGNKKAGREADDEYIFPESDKKKESKESGKTEKEIETLKKQVSAIEKKAKGKDKKFGDLLKKYRELMKKYGLNSAARIAGIGGLAYFILKYASNPDTRKTFEKYFGVDVFKLFDQQGTPFIEALKESLSRASKSKDKEAFANELKRFSDLFSSLRDIKKFIDTVPELSEQSTVAINKIELLQLEEIEKAHERGEKNKELDFGDLTPQIPLNQEERKKLYTFAEYLKKNKAHYLKNFYALQKKFPEHFGNLNPSKLSLIFVLRIMQHRDTRPWWLDIVQVRTLRARLIGFSVHTFIRNHIPTSLPTIFWDDLKFASVHKERPFWRYLGWGERRDYAQLMNYYQLENQRLTAETQKILETSVNNDEIKQQAKEIMDKKIRLAQLQNTSGASQTEISALREEISELNKGLNKKILDKLSSEDRSKYDELAKKISETRHAQIQNVLTFAALAEQQMKAEIEELKTKIKEAKETKDKQKIKAAKKALKEYKTTKRAELTRTITFELSEQLRTEMHEGQKTFAPGIEDAFNKHVEMHRPLLEKIMADASHPVWKSMSENLGLSVEDCQNKVARVLSANKSIKEGLIYRTVTGKLFSDMFPKAFKIGNVAGKSLGVLAIGKDVSNKKYLGATETGVTFLPIIGDAVDIMAAIRGKDWEGRDVTGLNRWIRGGMGGVFLVANVFSLGLVGTAGKVLTKGGMKAGSKLIEKGGEKLIAASPKLASLGKDLRGFVGTYVAFPLLGFTVYQHGKELFKSIDGFKIMGAIYDQTVKAGYFAWKQIDKYFLTPDAQKFMKQEGIKLQESKKPKGNIEQLPEF